MKAAVIALGALSVVKMYSSARGDLSPLKVIAELMASSNKLVADFY